VILFGLETPISQKNMFLMAFEASQCHSTEVKQAGKEEMEGKRSTNEWI
jgi:hypothetical protein